MADQDGLYTYQTLKMLSVFYLNMVRELKKTVSWQFSNSLMNYVELFPKAGEEILHEDSLNAKFIGGPNIVLLNGHEWKNQRKIANPAFRRSMPVKLFGKLTQELFKSMETMGDTVNVSDLMERWTLDAIGKAGFGKSIKYVLVVAKTNHS